MAFPDSSLISTGLRMPTFILGVVVLLYVASFVVFALIRIATGISIQRLGYLSLKRISYEPRDGVQIEIRKLGLLLHRPTFAQPTWISLVIQDSQITFSNGTKDADGTAMPDGGTPGASRRGSEAGLNGLPPSPGKKARATPLKKMGGSLERLKPLLQKLHKVLEYLRFMDLVVTNAAFTMTDVGTLHVGSFTMMVDTRLKTAERRRTLDQRKPLKPKEVPIEWMFTLRSILFAADGKENVEILNHCLCNLYGTLEPGVNVVKDSNISVKLGRVTIPWDDLEYCVEKFKEFRSTGKLRKKESMFLSLKTEQEADNKADRLADTLVKSKEFIQTLITNVQEVQFTVNYILVSKVIKSVKDTSEKPSIMNLEMKEIGMDIHRLDQSSPAHRMYFSPDDVAHQALLAAISLSLTLDDGQGKQDRLMYIPMVTMTSKTTLPSKSLQLAETASSDRNNNILLGNIVVTSPSVDLEPHHLPMLLELFTSKPGRSSRRTGEKAQLISRLLPKASVKFSVQEPVIRVLFPDPAKGYENSDMLISSHSSISADLESSYAGEENAHYALSASLRVASHQLYYRVSSGERHNLLEMETLEVRAQMTATPDVQVTIQAYLDTFAVRLVRTEIVRGLEQLMRQIRMERRSMARKKLYPAMKKNILRRMPSWITSIIFEGKDFSFDIAGIDAEVSVLPKGVALQLESLSGEYRSHMDEVSRRAGHRRRAGSKTFNPDEIRMSQPKSPLGHLTTDGRHFSVVVCGFECFTFEDADNLSQEPFLAAPVLQTELTTSTDADGPITRISTRLDLLELQYSLFTHYSFYVAATTLNTAFGLSILKKTKSKVEPTLSEEWGIHADSPFVPQIQMEFTGIDVRIQHIKFKAQMPKEPHIMMDLEGFEAGYHRWGFPYLKAKSARLFSQSPKVNSAWIRVISLRHTYVDFKKRHLGDHLRPEKCFDVTAEAIRLAIPHQLALYRVTDNVVNVIKAVEQVHHRYATGSNEYILEKKEEGPKKVPKVTLRTRSLLFELEDDPFESKLALNYRVGLVEQKMRLARLAAFHVKAQKLAEKRKQAREAFMSRQNTSHEIPKARRTKTRTMRLERIHTGSDTIKGKHRAAPRTEEKVHVEEEDHDETVISEDEAFQKLMEYDSTVWIQRIKWAQQEMAEKVTKKREEFWGTDDTEALNSEEVIIGLPKRPSLLTAYVNDVEFTVDRPTFARSELPDFLFRIGKGLPKNTKFAFLVPMGLRLDFSEAKILLRDYPLPFIHVPRMAPSQSARLSAWSLSADFVLAEELRNKESMRMARVVVVDPHEVDGKRSRGLQVDVRRTVSPVKSYSDFKVKINTSLPTRITWATSYQPAIQEMMMVFETFTKPHVDPSERIGFWDKIRHVFHSGITAEWRQDSEVQLNLKGSRDPYSVAGLGAGFIMCWKNKVRVDIGRDEDPQKFMKVESDEFVLAIPEFTKKARMYGEPIDADTSGILTAESIAEVAHFKKIIMKLSGNLRWLVGLKFEQDLGGPGSWKERPRSFNFIPHYDITLKDPQYATTADGEIYDAFKGFRSHYIHLSLSIACPQHRNWSHQIKGTSPSYNTIHLSPRFFTHFFAWWGLFAGNMSLPIRQGALWPGPEKSTKKFARHLATIEYQLLLSPLFISHIYKHNENEEGTFVGATGLKARLDSFMMDIHQRREEVTTTIKGLNRERLTFGMKINQAMVDLHAADVRAVSATIAGATVEDIKQAAEEYRRSYTDDRWMAADMSQFTIHDNDFSWVDLDDFIEVDWDLPANTTPTTVIMPLAFAPRFTYFRQTDHSPPGASPGSLQSPFGIHPSHDCVMDRNNDPREIQCELVQARLEKVNFQMSRNKEELDNLAERANANIDNKNSYIEEAATLLEQSSLLHDKIKFLESMLRRMSQRLDGETPEGDRPGSSSSEPEFIGLNSEIFTDYASDFDNRFIVHNVQAKWNNNLRNTIVRYINQMNQRRGIVYYMSRRAVKFLLDIVEEQKGGVRSSNREGSRTSTSTTEMPSSPTENATSPISVEQNFQTFLDDPGKFAKSFKSSQTMFTDSPAGAFTREDLTKDVSDDYIPENSYHVRLIAPQIQFQSDKDREAAVLLTAQDIQLKVVSIMDKKRLSDEVSGLVQRRYLANMDNAQFFVTNKGNFRPLSMWLHSANRYGADENTSWPPWVPLENMFNFHNTPLGFARVVERTSAILRFDKHNTLRLKYNDHISDGEREQTKEDTVEQHDNFERRVDNIWVDFPKVRVACDSAAYYSIFLIVQDVLLYSEPRQKQRSERLEKIMLASDFSDLRGTPEMVERLQQRIARLVEVKQYLQVNSSRLDTKGWNDMLAIDRDLNNCEDELFFLMKAITTAQRKVEDSQASGTLRWYISSDEVAWQLQRGASDPLADFRLSNASYQRVDSSDGSNYNTVAIQMIWGFNMLPQAVYPEMIAPYYERSPSLKEIDETQMLHLEWHMLEAIAGIPVINHFQVNLFPMKIQLEREIGQLLFEYIFPKTKVEDSNLQPSHLQIGKPDDPSEEFFESLQDSNSSIIHSEDSSSIMVKSEQASAKSIRSFASHRMSTISDPQIPSRVHSESAMSTLKTSEKPQPSPSHSFKAELSSNRTRKSMESTAPNLPSILASSSGDKSRKRQLFRSGDKRNEQSDELTQMIARASNYMTLVYIKIPSVVLCLSYKGKGERNFEDIHEFVFKLPQLEYRNKTWSNLDLALRLKKDIIRALISHTGAILGNKFTHHRPTAPKNANIFQKLTGASKNNAQSDIPDNYTLRRHRTSSTYSNTSEYTSHRDHSPASRRSSSSSDSRDPLPPAAKYESDDDSDDEDMMQTPVVESNQTLKPNRGISITRPKTAGDDTLDSSRRKARTLFGRTFGNKAAEA